MREISSQQFAHEYKFIRHQPEPILGDWDLYKHKKSSEKRLVKELNFYTENDMEDYLAEMISCLLYGSEMSEGVLNFLCYVKREVRGAEGDVFQLICIFEGYDSTLDKLVSRRIKDSQSFSPSELFKLLKRMVNVFSSLEREGYIHGDLRIGTIAILKSGEIKLIWAPFVKPTLRAIQDKPSIIRLMNPSPEICQAYNDAEIYREKYTTYPDFEAGVLYEKTDVYSLGMMIIRMFSLYSSGDFYETRTPLKTATRKVEATLLKINALNARLAFILNKMLTFDCFERSSFGQIKEIIEGNNNMSPMGNTLRNVRSSEKGVKVADFSDFSPDHRVNESFGVDTSMLRNKYTDDSPSIDPSQVDPTFRAFENIKIRDSAKKKPPRPRQAHVERTPIQNPALGGSPDNMRIGQDTSRYELILDKASENDLDISPYYASPTKKSMGSKKRSARGPVSGGKDPASMNRGNPYGNFSQTLPNRASMPNTFRSQKDNLMASISTIPLAAKIPRAPATQAVTIPENLFESRNLTEFKADLISKIEKVIFFDNSGKLRSGIKIREYAGSKFVGEMFCGKRDGIGIFYHKNGDVYVGRWSVDKMTGDCLYLFNNGSIYAGAVKEDSRDGFGRFLYTNGDVYEGNWLKGKKHGKGAYSYFSTGEVYDGDWSLGFKEGFGTLFIRGGSWYEGEWRSNKLVDQLNSGADNIEHHLPDIVEFYTDFKEWDRMLSDLEAMMLNRHEIEIDPELKEEVMITQKLRDRSKKPKMPSRAKPVSSRDKGIQPSERKSIEQVKPPLLDLPKIPSQIPSMRSSRSNVKSKASKKSRKSKKPSNQLNSSRRASPSGRKKKSTRSKKTN